MRAIRMRGTIRARRAGRGGALLAGALALALAAGACTGGPGATGSQGGSAAAASGPQRLAGVCPDTVVVQSNWFPEAEHGAAYQLLGPGYRVDAAHKRISGPLVASGKDTGVRIEIRAGGPAVGFQSSAALMYQDPDITLGMLQSDAIAQFSRTQPVVGVVAPLELDPQILLWDPKSHPDWHTITDIGQTDTPVPAHRRHRLPQLRQRADGPRRPEGQAGAVPAAAGADHPAGAGRLHAQPHQDPRPHCQAR